MKKGRSLLKRVKKALPFDHFGRERLVIDGDCPIRVLQDPNSALDELITYLDLVGLASLLQTSRGMRAVLKTAMKTVLWHKSMPQIEEQAREGELSCNEDVDFAYINEKILTNLAEWLVKFLPMARLGDRSGSPTFGDMTRALLCQRGFKKGLKTLKNFSSVTSLCLELQGGWEGERSKHQDSLVRFLFRERPENLTWLEIVGGSWRTPTMNRGLAFFNMTDLAPKNRHFQPSDGSLMPVNGEIFIWIGEELRALETLDAIIENLSGTTDWDDERNIFDWKSQSGLRIHYLKINATPALEILEKCMELEMNLRLLEVKLPGSVHRLESYDIAKFVTEHVDMIGYLDDRTKLNRDIQTVEEMMELPVIRLFNECNKCFRRYLQTILDDLYKKETGNKTKRLEIFRSTDYYNPWSTVEVFVYAVSLWRTWGYLPPKRMTFYQPYYLHQELNDTDVSDLTRLTGVKRIYIRRGRSGVGTDDCAWLEQDTKINKILRTISSTLVAHGNELDELRVGWLPEFVFVNARHNNAMMKGEDRRWGEIRDYTYYDMDDCFPFVWRLFPYLRLVKKVEQHKKDKASRLDYLEQCLTREVGPWDPKQPPKIPFTDPARPTFFASAKIADTAG